MNAKTARLADRAIVAVGGAQARDFLHNVVTGDVAALEPGGAVYSALLTPQGKILFDFIVCRNGDNYLLDCARDHADLLAQRLSMYKLRADVTITADLETAVNAVWHGEPPKGTAQVFADPRTPDLGWRVLGVIKTNAGLDEYHAHRIALGIADAMLDIGSGEVFPHEANMDQLGGVSFSKGCYIGQEVVSRMQHRGTARTRFLIARAGSPLTSGADVNAGDRRIGSIKSVAGNQALALVRIDRLASAAASGAAVTSEGAKLELAVPDWARFGIHEANGGEE